MGMVVRTNTMALNAYRQLGMNNSAVSKSLEKLSSGFRINRAGDDAAGLAISEKMKAQIKGLETASANAQDGISLIQTAEGNLSEVHDMLNRMVELATKSANGTYTSTERRALQDEVDSLLKEIDRISESANFNGTNLLDGSLSATGKISDGSSRMLSKLLAAGDDPVAQVGIKTMLDGGKTVGAAKTKFEIDFSDIKVTGGVDAVAGTSEYTPDANNQVDGITVNVGDTAKAQDGDVKVTVATATDVAKVNSTVSGGGTGIANTISFTYGENDAATFNGVKIAFTKTGAAGNTSTTWDKDTKTLTVNLANDGGTAGAYNAADLQTIIQGVGKKDGYDFSKVTVADTATAAVNAAGTTAGTIETVTFANGVSKKDAGFDVTIETAGGTVTKNIATAAWTGSVTVDGSATNGTSVTIDTAKVTAAVAETTVGSVAASTDKDPKISLKIGNTTVVSDLEVSRGATEDEIAQKIVAKLQADDANGEAKVSINGVDWIATAGGKGLTFEMKDLPTTDATKLRGDFAWDISGGTNVKIEGNHSAGTIVTQQGALSTTAARANTVFRVGASDIKDGTVITIDDKKVILAVGKDSTIKDGDDVKMIDLKDMEADKVDLHTALSRISEGFKDYTTNFEVSVSDNTANNDVQTGLAVYKKIGSTNVYDTKEKLAAVFGMSTGGKALTLQIGDSADDFNKMDVSVDDMSTQGLKLSGLSIMTETDASDAINKIKIAINTVSSTRAGMGALQNRLEHTINNLDVAVENLSAANSRIRDTDMAKEMMNYTKMNVLVQSAQAMLAQANQQPQSVLQLLQ